MAVWIRNLRTAIEDKNVILLHGNVRDRYIDDDGRLYDNLTALLSEIAGHTGRGYAQMVVYDLVGRERTIPLATASTGPAPPPAATAPRTPAGRDDEMAAPAPASSAPAGDKPARVLARWARELADVVQRRFYVIFYLDKLVSYKTSYSDEERETLLWLEKLIENISPTNRLVMVALQDTMVPLEIYTQSPKCRIVPIPPPAKADRSSYLASRLGDSEHRGLVADLTDGLYLRELDHVIDDVQAAGTIGPREVRQVINRYRIGEQEDHWGALSIDRLNRAARWFIEEENVKGQDDAVRRVVDMLCLARAGLSGMASGTPSKPRGVLFFAGPTGVGKTLVAKKLAKFLFSTEEAFVRIDMSELKEEHSVSKLIGSPPGYVGYERGGMLTNAVKEKPFSIVLFDEIEKAHPKIMDVFLQLLDEGRLTDSRGQTVFFTETVIIFTSNLGCRSTLSARSGRSERAALDDILRDSGLDDAARSRSVGEHFVRSVEEFFFSEISRPELYNRIGNNIIPFHFISGADDQREIVQSHLRRIQSEFEDRFRGNQFRLETRPEVVDYLCQRNAHRMAELGARGITHAIESSIMGEVARAVLAAEFRQRTGVLFTVAVAGDELTVTAS